MTPRSDHRRRGACGGAALLVMVLLAPAGAAQELEGEPGEWLARMSHAISSLSYEGVFVYQHQQRLETMRIVHQAGPDGTRERLLSLNGAPREIIRNGDQVTCILPDNRSVVVDRTHPRSPFPDGLSWDAQALSEHYDAVWVGRDRMCGRECRMLAVRAKDRYRYGYRLWLDEQSALPLKIDLLGVDNQPLEQMMFTSITIQDRVDPEQLQPVTDGREFTWYRGERDSGASVARDADSSEPSEWRIRRMPPGFELVRHERRRLPSSSAPVEHMVLGDGLASVSVYIEDETALAEPFTGGSRMGAVNAYGRMVGGHPITVVGEVPRATVEMIARSIVHVEPTE